MEKHYNIPVFIPELACPFRCIYCNQFRITSSCKAPSESEVEEIIKKHLLTLPKNNSVIQLAFFGGSFTGLPTDQQKRYFEIARPYLDNGRISGIRISTRPDYINAEILEILCRSGVTAIELGAQSLDDDVLYKSGRGHTVVDVIHASGLIKSMGFELGLQMMVGLPGDTPERSMETAKKIIELGADTTRIYPTLVIKDTPLAGLFSRGLYVPLTLDEAIDQCAVLFELFTDSCVKILRVGLHPSEGLINRDSLVSGPFDVAMGEKVATRFWGNKFKPFLKSGVSEKIEIRVHPSDINAAIGHCGVNKKTLLQWYKRVFFMPESGLKKFSFDVDFH